MKLSAKKNRVHDDENVVSEWSGVDLNHRHTDFQSVIGLCKLLLLNSL